MTPTRAPAVPPVQAGGDTTSIAALSLSVPDFISVLQQCPAVFHPPMILAFNQEVTVAAPLLCPSRSPGFPDFALIRFLPEFMPSRLDLLLGSPGWYPHLPLFPIPLPRF